MEDTPLLANRWMLVATLVGGAALISAPGCAEDPPRPPGPPPAAIAACRGQPTAAPCQFEDQGHWITGTCQMRGPDWVCVPDRAPPGDRLPPNEAAWATADRPAAAGTPPRPPREAFEACLGRLEGSDCEVRTPHGPVKGRCGRDREGLACIPRDPSQGPGDNPPAPRL